MSNPDAYALLVGVGTYDDFAPDGSANLEGPPHDVRTWWRIARALGVPPENIRVCADPAPPAGSLWGGEAATHTGATRAELVDGLRWLAAQLDGVGGQKALLTWSSHGTRTPQGQVLCPSDLTADGTTLHHALTMAEVGALLGQRAPHTRLTAFVDTCHDDTGFDDPQLFSRALPWAHAAPASAGQPAALGHRVFGDLVVSSSQPGTVSYELPAVGDVHGAFSWTAANLIHRWGAADAAGGETAGLTYASLVEGTRVMLRGLSVSQAPIYIGDPLLADTQVFSGFGDHAVGDAAPQALGGAEIWPTVPTGKVYSALIHKANGGSTLGTLYLTGPNAPTGWASNTQYWAWKHGDWPNGTSFEVDAPANMSSPSDKAPTNAQTYGLSDLKPAEYAPQDYYMTTYCSWRITPNPSGGTMGYMWADTNAASRCLHTYSVQTSPGQTLLTGYAALRFTSCTSGETYFQYTASATDPWTGG